LHVEEEDPLVDQLLPLQAQRLEARHPDDAEEDEIVDVDEVAEGGDDHRQGEDFVAGGGWFGHGGHLVGRFWLFG
jgi:hypothetical protein